MNATDPLAKSDVSHPAQSDHFDARSAPALNELARRAAAVMGTTMAAISFFERARAAVDGPLLIKRERFKAQIGMSFSVLDKEQCFFLPAFTETPQRPPAFVVGDAPTDPRFRHHPMVAGPPYIHFYAGCGIFSAGGELLGVLSVFDTAARKLAAQELEALANLAELARARLAARAEVPREHRAVPVGGRAVSTAAAAEQRLGLLAAESVQLKQLLEVEIHLRKASEAKVRYEENFSLAAIDSRALE